MFYVNVCVYIYIYIYTYTHTYAYILAAWLPGQLAAMAAWPPGVRTWLRSSSTQAESYFSGVDFPRTKGSPQHSSTPDSALRAPPRRTGRNSSDEQWWL